MAMAKPCDSCAEQTSYVFAAQFWNGENDHMIICGRCWNAGVRCWFSDNKLSVGVQQPPNSVAAALYWDEGGYVTGGDIPITYPSIEQEQHHHD